ESRSRSPSAGPGCSAGDARRGAAAADRRVPARQGGRGASRERGAPPARQAGAAGALNHSGALMVETVIARCSVHAAAEDPNYAQQVRCGRHEFLVDERAARGGADAGPMPFEYLLGSLGACTSITLRMYAERHGWNIGAVDVSLTLRKGDNASRI